MNKEFKLMLIQKLKNRPVYFRQVNDVEYKTRCPFCGDSQKTLNTGHMYIRINPNDNFPIVYNCFKCPAKGVLNYNTLEMMGILGNGIKEAIYTINKTSDKVPNTDYKFTEYHFDYYMPGTYDKRKVSYLENRLGFSLTEDHLIDMKVITSLKEFFIVNGIHFITCKAYMAKLLERDYIGFLSHNNTHILFRDTTDRNKIHWYKYPITPQSVDQRCFYSISTDINLYTKDKIIVNLAEGVMDILSINYNLNYQNLDNVLNIAVCGKYYNSIIRYLFGLGFIGSNVEINIFPDNDHTEDTSPEYYKKIFKNYSYLVNKITLNYNLKSKDCGVPKDKILLNSFRI